MSQHLLRAAAMLIPKGAPPGQQEYTTAGTYSWTCPVGVTSVSVVVVNTGYNGSGGNLSYKNNISVTPGNSYTVVTGATGTNTTTYFKDTSTVAAWYGSGNRVGDGGGNGGTGGGGAGGGGAGGYSGNGGEGQADGGTPAATSGSGGGGGGGTTAGTYPTNYTGSGGGGVGLLGQGSNGAGGTGDSGGGGGSGGANGGSKSGTSTGGTGGSYGGAGGYQQGSGYLASGNSAVRIIWPGTARQFPSTRTTNE